MSKLHTDILYWDNGPAGESNRFICFVYGKEGNVIPKQLRLEGGRVVGLEDADDSDYWLLRDQRGRPLEYRIIDGQLYRRRQAGHEMHVFRLEGLVENEFAGIFENWRRDFNIAVPDGSDFKPEIRKGKPAPSLRGADYPPLESELKFPTSEQLQPFLSSIDSGAADVGLQSSSVKNTVGAYPHFASSPKRSDREQAQEPPRNSQNCWARCWQHPKAIGYTASVLFIAGAALVRNVIKPEQYSITFWSSIAVLTILAMVAVYAFFGKASKAENNDASESGQLDGVLIMQVSA